MPGDEAAAHFRLTVFPFLKALNCCICADARVAVMVTCILLALTLPQSVAGLNSRVFLKVAKEVPTYVFKVPALAEVERPYTV